MGSYFRLWTVHPARWLVFFNDQFFEWPFCRGQNVYAYQFVRSFRFLVMATLFNKTFKTHFRWTFDQDARVCQPFRTSSESLNEGFNIFESHSECERKCGEHIPSCSATSSNIVGKFEIMNFKMNKSPHPKSVNFIASQMARMQTNKIAQLACVYLGLSHLTAIH